MLAQTRSVTTEYTLNPFDIYAKRFRNELMIACHKTDEGKLPNCITYKVLDEIIPKGYYRIGDESYLVIWPNIASNDELDALVLAYNHLLEMAKSIYSQELIERKFSDPFLSAASNSSSATANEVVVPVMYKGGVYEVPVEINRMLKLNFILDSGASDVFISEHIASTLITGGTVTDVDVVGRQTYTLADGSTEECLVINLRSVKIGTIEIRNVMCGVSKSIHAPMLLGQSFLKRFGSYTLDNKANTLTIKK
jgi:clan AA aspartic protease (TIGR02281 family)